MANSARASGVISGRAECHDCGQIIDDKDLWGGDLPNMPIAATTPQDCQVKCFVNTRCNAFNFEKGNCWLKSGVSNFGPADGRHSGVINDRGDTKQGMDLVGGDMMEGFSVGDEYDCSSRCGGNPSCVAWSYNTCEKKCYLKQSLPKISFKQDCSVSGTIYSRGSAYSDTSYDVVTVSQDSKGIRATLKLVKGVQQFGDDIKEIDLHLTYETNERIRFVLKDANKQRYEPPSFLIAEKPTNTSSADSSAFNVELKKSPFSLKISKKKDGKVILDTDATSHGISNLVFKDQYIQISNSLPSGASLYGLGENIRSVRLPYSTFTMWNSDAATPDNINLYGSYPFYLDVRNDGSTTGMHLSNTNAMDIVFSQESGADVLTYKVTGGILDFYVFDGSGPEGVMNEYNKLVGRPYQQAYWTLGFHQCRWGYHNINDLKTVVSKYRSSGIPLETMWTDIDYMDAYKCWTFDPKNFPEAEMGNFVDQLHADGQHYVPIIDPGVKTEAGYFVYDNGNKLDLWIKNAQGTPLHGKVWPGAVYFPDWFHPATTKWWLQSAQQAHQKVKFDGVWTDMNEISNFCDGECTKRDVNNPPYSINNKGSHSPLQKATISVDAKHYNGMVEYDVHNIHSYMETMATSYVMETIRGTRSFILSRSSFAGAGSRGAHWTGDNYSSWPSLKQSIKQILTLAMGGMEMTGADICGFFDNTTEELCGRWIQVGAFYAFSRNHNIDGAKPQELYTWDSVAKISKTVLSIKYSLLPYYYTLQWKSHVGRGSTVLRPLFFEFASDATARGIDAAFLVGPGLLISPVLDQGSTNVKAYIPKASVWYDFYTFEELKNTNDGWNVLDAPIDKINVHIKGGVIVPQQRPAYSVRDSRKNPFTLLVALDAKGTSNGMLYLDDGETINVQDQYSEIQFSANTTSFQSNPVKTGYSAGSDLYVEKVVIMGLPSLTRPVKVSGPGSATHTYDSGKKLLTVMLQSRLQKSFSIQY